MGTGQVEGKGESKSVAEARGWENSHHADIMRIAHALVSVTDAPDRQRRRLRSAQTLHVNFYEDEEPPESIQEGIKRRYQAAGGPEGCGVAFPD